MQRGHRGSVPKTKEELVMRKNRLTSLLLALLLVVQLVGIVPVSAADNYVMQNMLKKCGFIHCGTIYLEDGEPRLAFHKEMKK